MPKFIVCEVQEEIVWRKFQYEVEAASAEEAITKVRCGEAGDAEEMGHYGDTDLGRSGFAASPADEELCPSSLYDEAADRLADPAAS
jgi:hypothetical protein